MARTANHTSQETKQQIVDAFLVLYEQYPIEKISIRMLSEEAKINRGTFYYYYADIYELLAEIEEDIIGKLSTVLPKIVEGFLCGIYQKTPDFVMDYYHKNFKYITLFLAIKPNHKLVSFAKDCAKTAVLKFFHKKAEELTIEEQCMLEYVVDAHFGTICWCLVHVDEISVEELMGLLQRLGMNGPLTVLKEVFGIQQSV